MYSVLIKLRLIVVTLLLILGACSPLKRASTGDGQTPVSPVPGASTNLPPASENQTPTPVQQDESHNQPVSARSSLIQALSFESFAKLFTLIRQGDAASQETASATPAAATKPRGFDQEPCYDIDCQQPSEYLFSAPSESQRTFVPDIWFRIRKGLALDYHIKDPRFHQELEWYSQHPRFLERTMKKAERYIHHVVEQTEAKGLPLELALLPVVESGFDPFAYSHGRASGLWQFIPSTGDMYGLRQDWWYDGRRDVVASTEAALTYLQVLANQFDGDWVLALAAYNSGEGTVAKAIRANKKQGKPTDFWHLSLPKETEAYVPKLLAIAKIISAPEDYDLELYPIPNEPYFQVMKLKSQIDLAHAADLAETDVEEIYLLNPGFNRWATAPTGPHRLAVPVESADRFASAIKKLTPMQQLNWRRHKIEAGDSLIGIAKQYRTTPDVIRQINKLTGHEIQTGQTLLIPVAAQSKDFYSFSQGNRRAAKQAIKPVSNATRIDYKVKSGDTFWDLSRTYQVSVRSLAKWNNMAPGDPLKPGSEIVIWSPVTPSPVTAGIGDITKREGKIRKVVYTVRSGDSIEGIANKFKINTKSLIGWNSLNRKKHLQPGQKLTLYVNVTDT